jgi:hypothetical protein
MRGAGGWHLPFQRRITVFKGVRLNVGKRGLGVTVGGRLARFGVTSRGQLYQSASIPGTGISMRRTLGSVATFGGFILAASEFDHACNDRPGCARPDFVGYIKKGPGPPIAPNHNRISPHRPNRLADLA